MKGFCVQLFLCAAFVLAAGAREKTSFEFDFTTVPAKFYSPESGYGFEPGATITVQKYFITSTNPFYFSVKLPEGNYKVTITFAGESIMTVKAELRRLMLEKIHTADGQFATRSFIVNVRTPKISSNGEVRLKPRERADEWRAWDEKMTLEFNGANPSLQSLKIEPVKVPTLFIAGDSTVCDQPREPWNSWGQMLPRFFKPEIAIANHAESGESIRSSLGARRFEKVFSLMKSGDWLFVQFGHNDMKDRATNALAVYGSNLKKIVAQTRARGGTPVLVTSMERKDGVERDTLGGYPAAMREVAKEENVALIDLHAMSKLFYKTLGVDLDKAFKDGTHHNNYGSYELARCVIAGIRQNKLGLVKFLADGAGNFDPAKPDAPENFTVPPSPEASAKKPEGD